MTPKWRAAAPAGRIGALAVALGMSAAMATGHGVAWADTSDGESSSAGTTSSSGSSPTGSTDKPTRSARLFDRRTPSDDAAADSASVSDPRSLFRGGGPALQRILFGSGGFLVKPRISDKRPGLPTEEESDTPSTDADVTDADVADEPLESGPEADAAEPATDADAQADPAEPETDADSEDNQADTAGDPTPAADDAGSETDKPLFTRTVTAPRPMVSSKPAESKQPEVPAVSDLIQSVRARSVVAVQDTVDLIAESDIAAAPSADVAVPRRTAAAASSVAPEAELTRTVQEPSAPTRQRPVPRLVSSLLAAVGFAPLLANTPGAPAQPPALWALLAWARKEFDRIFSPAAKTAAAQPSSLTTAAAVVDPLPTSLDSTPIGWVTGQNNNLQPGRDWDQTNNTAAENIYGTDLGIMWLNTKTGKIQLAFGDTFSGPNMTGDWRSNVLLLSTDNNLTDGLTLLQTGPTFQFIPSAPRALGLLGSEVTVIPTAAISIQDEQYVNYMSVKSWDSPGRWTTNYSAVSKYNESIDRWELVDSTVRSAGWLRSSTRYVAGDQNFQQTGYVLEQTDSGEPGYVYVFGTPSGRQGSVHLARVAEPDVENLSQYEYWDGEQWVADKPAVAAPIIGDSTKSRGLFGFVRDLANNPNFFGGYFGGLVGAKNGGNVGEMSVQYNEYLDQYVVLYGTNGNQVHMRTADTPEGPWSDPIVLATSQEYHGLYAPMIHPLSGTGQLVDGDGDPDVTNLYWNMSLWDNYNVVLMQTDLAELNAV